MFTDVLVANRGEIAVRVAATLRRLGVRSTGVHTPADAGSRHVRELDRAVALDADDGYLDAEAIVAAALQSGCEAVHPGYGFLAESPRLARACAAAGLVFVGPSAEVIELMGDKVAARAAAEAAGVPVLPGRSEPGLSDDDLRHAAGELGFPLMLKPAAGGGGKGMRVVRSVEELDAALPLARNEARAAFGDDALFLERYLAPARHVEVQVLADAHGNVVHLGERECSLQRRQQKVIEEAPAPRLPPEVREAMCGAAVALARSCGYEGAGTVEMIVPAGDPAGFSFLEMNTRLQVEHRVTELVWGLDLVEQQLLVACGEPLAFAQGDLAPRGHAVEARLYAEDPERDFLPTGGRVLALRLPDVPAGHVVAPAPGDDGPRVLADRGVDAGDRVGSEYDPLLAKVVAWAPRRDVALERLAAELEGSCLLGVVSNLALLVRLLRRRDVVEGELDTGLIEREAAGRGATGTDRPEDDRTLVAAALALHLARAGGAGDDPWDDTGGWRVGEPAWARVVLRGPGRSEVELAVRGFVASAGSPLAEGEVAVATGPPRPAGAALVGTAGVPGSGVLTLEIDHCLTHHDVAFAAGQVWIGGIGRATAFGHVRHRSGGPDMAHAGDGVVRSPMPGVVRRVDAAPGQAVRRGEVLAVVEAMKMQHPILAPMDGVVLELRPGEGARVEYDEVLARIGPIEDR